MPPFDETAALCLPDLLDEMHETVEDGGLPCPSCATVTRLHMSSSWHRGQVALLQVVREASADGAMNRTALFAPKQFDGDGRAYYVLRAAVLHQGLFTRGADTRGLHP